MAGALNAVGQRLKPRVFCVPNLRNRGAGLPDMGLFVLSRAQTPEDWPEAQAPERGVVEVDDFPADLSVKAGSEQVRDYLAAYGLVLVTNYRDFVLLGRDAQGQPERRESFSFGCADADAFFALARGQRAHRARRAVRRVPATRAAAPGTARPAGGRCVLPGILCPRRAGAGGGASKPARFRGTAECVAGSARAQFEGPKGEHLFRSNLVQTLFYGLFSAWVEVAQDGQATSIGARRAGASTFPSSIRCFSASPRRNRSNRSVWRSRCLGGGGANRVDRDAFFARFEEADAVRYFYEPFLAAFDPELRK